MPPNNEGKVPNVRHCNPGDKGFIINTAEAAAEAGEYVVEAAFQGLGSFIESVKGGIDSIWQTDPKGEETLNQNNLKRKNSSHPFPFDSSKVPSLCFSHVQSPFSMGHTNSKINWKGKRVLEQLDSLFEALDDPDVGPHVKFVYYVHFRNANISIPGVCREIGGSKNVDGQVLPYVKSRVLGNTPCGHNNQQQIPTFVKCSLKGNCISNWNDPLFQCTYRNEFGRCSNAVHLRCLGFTGDILPVQLQFKCIQHRTSRY